MSNKRPFFFFAFANDNKNYLDALKDEERLLRKSLAAVHDDEIAEFLSLSHSY